MGIDIYATPIRKAEAPSESSPRRFAGSTGYLRESYHGEPYATAYLCSEAFQSDSALISASLLRERLPHTLELVEEKWKKICGSPDDEIEQEKQEYCDFVEFCEESERETGLSVRIVADC